MVKIMKGERWLETRDIGDEFCIGYRTFLVLREEKIIRPAKQLNGHLLIRESEARYFREHVRELMANPKFYRIRNEIASQRGWDNETRAWIKSFKLSGYISPVPGINYYWYSPTFTHEFRERVRNFFGRHCAECGAVEDGRRLHVHHVNCGVDADCEAPGNLFVPLCGRCHSQAHGKHGDELKRWGRDHWNAHFAKIVRDRWGGRCYLPKDDPGVPSSVT